MKRKIYFLATRINNPVTGGEIFNHHMLNSLTKSDADIEVLPLDIGCIRYRRYLYSNIILLFLLNKGSILITDIYLQPYIFLGTAIFKMLKQGRLLLIIHHLSSQHYVKKFLLKFVSLQLEKLLIRLADTIVVTSCATKKEVTDLGNPRDIKVIEPGMDLEFTQSPKKDDATHLLFVGTCSERKGILYLLEAMTYLKGSNIKLDIVGDTKHDKEYYKKMLNFIEKADICSKVAFHGKVTKKKLSEFYASSDIFVLPSLWEGYGMVLQEAMYFGLPIISTLVGAIPLLIENKKNGLLVPPGDSSSLANAIKVLDENPQIRDKMRQNNLKERKKFVSWQESDRKFLTCLKKIMKTL